MKQRLQLWDAARGLGIVIGILSHSWAVADSPTLQRMVLSFHMPLFFFIWGVFLNDERPARELLVARVHAWLKPYVVILVAIGVLQWWLARSAGESFSAWRYLAGAVWATADSLPVPALWIFPHVFMASTLLSLLLPRLEGVASWVRGAMFALIAVGGLVWLWRFDADRIAGMPYSGLPWELDILPVTLVFLALGHAVAPALQQFRPRWYWLVSGGVVFLGLLWQSNAILDIADRQLEQPVWAVAKAGVSIYLALAAAWWATQHDALRRGLVWLGTASVAILLFQREAQHLIFAQLNQWLPGWPTHGLVSIAVATLFLVGLSILGDRSRVVRWLLRAPEHDVRTARAIPGRAGDPVEVTDAVRPAETGSAPEAASTPEVQASAEAPETAPAPGASAEAPAVEAPPQPQPESRATTSPQPPSTSG